MARRPVPVPEKSRRWMWWAAGAVVVVVAGLVTWGLWPAKKEPPRARVYLDYTACLLTDANGLQSAEAAPVWAGMQKASLATHAKVQYLAVTGEQTADNATPFLNSLAQRHCSQIFATGAAPAAAARKAASTFAGVSFYVVGGSGGSGNLTVIPSGGAAAVTTSVDEAIVHGVGASHP
jgi:hypothetical protein